MDRGRPENPLEYAPTGELYQGSAIRQMRKAKRLNLRQLAAKIPYPYGALSNVENNISVISNKKLKKIAEILEVDADELEQMPLHPRLSKKTEGFGKTTNVEQKNVLAELKEEVQELKSGFAEVKATVKEMHSYLRDLVRSLVPQTTPAWNDLDGQQIRTGATSGSGQEPTDSKRPGSNPVRVFVEKVIMGVNDLEPVENLHSGQVMLTYLVEKDAFGGDRRLEEQWLAMLEGAIDKGWDIYHLIWLNGEMQRASHLVRNFHSLSGKRGDYLVYYTKTAPLGGSVDYVAVESENASLRRAFEYYALDAIVWKGPHAIDNFSAIYPTDDYNRQRIEDILNRLKRWRGGEGGFEPLLNVVHLQKLLGEMASERAFHIS